MTDLQDAPAWAVAELHAQPEPFTGSGATAELYKDLVPALAAMQNVARDTEGTVGTRKTKYASLSAVMDVARKLLGEHHLALIQAQTIEYESGRTFVTVYSRLIHTSGEWLESRVALSTEVNATPQQIGSALTYGRRYGASALLGLAPTDDDDDGSSASTRQQQGNGTPVNDPFAGRGNYNAAGELLVSREVHKRILDAAHDLTTEQRTELSAWREAEGIRLTPDSLTMAQARAVLVKLGVEPPPATEDAPEPPPADRDEVEPSADEEEMPPELAEASEALATERGAPTEPDEAGDAESAPQPE